MISILIFLGISNHLRVYKNAGIFLLWDFEVSKLFMALLYIKRNQINPLTSYV
jgi:hypothetical protein